MHTQVHKKYRNYPIIPLPEVCSNGLRLAVVHIDHGHQKRQATDVQEARKGLSSTDERLVQSAFLGTAGYGAAYAFLRARKHGHSINICDRGVCNDHVGRIKSTHLLWGMHGLKRIEKKLQ